MAVETTLTPSGKARTRWSAPGEDDRDQARAARPEGRDDVPSTAPVPALPAEAAARRRRDTLLASVGIGLAATAVVALGVATVVQGRLPVPVPFAAPETPAGVQPGGEGQGEVTGEPPTPVVAEPAAQQPEPARAGQSGTPGAATGGAVVVPAADTDTGGSPAPAPEPEPGPAPAPPSAEPPSGPSAGGPPPSTPPPAQPEGPASAVVDPVVGTLARTVDGATGGATRPVTEPVGATADGVTDLFDTVLTLPARRG